MYCAFGKRVDRNIPDHAHMGLLQDAKITEQKRHNSKELIVSAEDQEKSKSKK